MYALFQSLFKPRQCEVAENLLCEFGSTEKNSTQPFENRSLKSLGQIALLIKHWGCLETGRIELRLKTG
jgi:hypothetical protein